jgi:hypothetical protein
MRSPAIEFVRLESAVHLKRHVKVAKSLLEVKAFGSVEDWRGAMPSGAGHRFGYF